MLYCICLGIGEAIVGIILVVLGTFKLIKKKRKNLKDVYSQEKRHTIAPCCKIEQPEKQLR